MVRIIRTCSLGVLALALAAPGVAQAERNAPSALGDYLHARLIGGPDAANRLAAALTAEPRNNFVALRAFREAMRAGDRRLAERAALQLEAADALPSDARLLLFSIRLQAGDLAGARTMADRIAKQPPLDFAAPVLTAWTSFAARNGDAGKTLTSVERDSLTTLFASEHRALIALQRDRLPEALTLVRAEAVRGLRARPLRLSAAATVARRGDAAGAQAIAGGAFDRTDEIDTAAKGVAYFYAQFSAQLLDQQSPEFALALARLARWSDPKSNFAAIVEARALIANGRSAEAIVQIKAMKPSASYAQTFRAVEVSALAAAGDKDAGIAAMGAMAGDRTSPIEQIRLAEMFASADRASDAAKSYAAAIAALRGVSGDGAVPSEVWLAYGRSLERADDWDGAKAALKTAVAAGPDDAAALNHLGYGMLERRENLGEALKLIEKASLLRPDDAAIADSLGWAQYLNGDAAAALGSLERATLIAPEEPTISEHLGDVYWSAGRRIEARYAWAAALARVEGAAAKRLGDKIDIGLSAANAAR